MQFVYDPLPCRGIFGAGSVRRVADELSHVGSRALVLSTPEQAGSAQELAATLGDKAVGLFSKAVMHVPVATVDAAAAVARELDADCTVAIGGGSTVEIGRAHV